MKLDELREQLEDLAGVPTQPPAIGVGYVHRVARRQRLARVAAVSVVVVIVIMGVGALFLRSDDASPPVLPAQSTQFTTSDVYTNVAKALDRSGQTFVELWTITSRATATQPAMRMTERIWADAHGNRLRVENVSEIHRIGAVVDSTRVHTAISGSSAGPNQTPTICHGTSATVSFVLACPGPSTAIDQFSQTVRSGQWHGRKAVVLDTSETFRSGTSFQERIVGSLYLDSKTWQPFARRTVSNLTASDPTRSEGPVRSSFVNTESLPRSYFTAASIERWSRPSQTP